MFFLCFFLCLLGLGRRDGQIHKKRDARADESIDGAVERVKNSVLLCPLKIQGDQ